MAGRGAQSWAFVTGAAAAALGVTPLTGHAAPAAKPDAPRFVPVPANNYRLFGYLDTASITRAKGDVSFSILVIGDRYRANAAFAEGERLTATCAWGVYRAAPGWTTYAEDAQATPEAPNPDEARPRYPYPGSIEANAIDMVCEPGAVAPGVERLTFIQSFVRGREAVKEVIPALPVPPVERRGPPPTFPDDVLKLAVVTPSRGGGPTRFLDWAKRRSNGQSVVALTVDVLGSAGLPRAPSVVARVGLYNCPARTVTVAAMFGYTATGLPAFTKTVPQEQRTARPVAAGSPDAEALDATCAAQEPAKTIGSMADAVASVLPAAAAGSEAK